MAMVKWVDFLGRENILMQGRNDDVFHTIPSLKDEEGESFVQVLSKKALVELVEKMKSSDQ